MQNIQQNTIQCEPRFDVWAVQRLEKDLARNQQGRTNLRLNLGKVTFIDKTALNYLKSLAKSYHLTLQDVSVHAKVIFQLTRFQL